MKENLINAILQKSRKLGRKLHTIVRNAREYFQWIKPNSILIRINNFSPLCRHNFHWFQSKVKSKKGKSGNFLSLHKYKQIYKWFIVFLTIFFFLRIK